MFAPWRISRLASTECPCKAATCSGVKPSKLQLFTASAPVCRTHIYTDTRTKSGLTLCFTFPSFTFLSHLMCRRTAGTLAERVTQQSLNLLFILLFCPFEQETHLHTCTHTHSFRGDQFRRPTSHFFSPSPHQHQLQLAAASPPVNHTGSLLVVMETASGRSVPSSAQ